MKHLLLIAVVCITMSCDQHSTGNSPQFNNLVGTWIVKELLVDGLPDPENFPVDDDKLIINNDMTVIGVSKTNNTEDTGKWELISRNQFTIITEENERVVFQILKLNETELKTKMLTNKIDLVINYAKDK